MPDWLSLLNQLQIPDGAVAGLSVSDKPKLKGKLLQLPAADRLLFFDGEHMEVLQTLRTLLPDAPPGQPPPIPSELYPVAASLRIVWASPSALLAANSR